MIRLKSITISRGGVPLLENASASISPTEHLALIGANGSGKSTLLAALSGELSLDAGEIEQPFERVVRLAQGLPRSDKPAWRHVHDSDPDLTRAIEALERADACDDGEAIADAHQALETAGGHDAEPRARALLAGLGFSSAEAEARVDALSGGWKMRLNLARALFVRSDVLLLDEPTNHLDLDAILWLERWLGRYEGIAIVVSHDRDFLDRVAKATLSIEDRRLLRYAGGYSATEQQRAERVRLADKAFRRDSVKAAQLQRFIDRFRAKATKARQVQSRLKALERLSLEAPARSANGLDFSLEPAGDCADPLLLAEDLSVGYEATPVLSGVDFTLERGARVGVLGRNGAGKTTLIRALIGELPAQGGDLHRAAAVRIGYFAQQAVEALRPEDSALSHMRRIAPDEREVSIRAYLGRFGFSGENALREVGPMSGGERARLVLAQVVWAKPQLLILDEPTNHLDASARDSLTEALAEFDGALMLVSHDRYLLRASVDRFVLVADGTLAPFEGDLDDYAAWMLANRAERSSISGTPGDVDAVPAAANRRGARRAAAAERAERAARVRPLDRRIAEVERGLATASSEIAQIDEQMAQPGFYDKPAPAADTTRRRAELSAKASALEDEWLALSEERERLLAD
ncbi:MAG: ATP-binding cassette domain-containing protein [Burkholderiaceae bacterium]|nr:ATP-binding cassette domain-containing protein [Burkholderiaceae bacterium]